MRNGAAKCNAVFYSVFCLLPHDLLSEPRNSSGKDKSKKIHWTRVSFDCLLPTLASLVAPDPMVAMMVPRGLLLTLASLAHPLI